MAEINVTPMVDVMLVLLVVFMVTAPLLTVGVPVDLPETAAPAINEPKEPLTITVNRDGAVFLQETGIEDGDLEHAIELMRQHKAIEDTIERARHYGAIAHDALAIFPDSEHKAAMLEAVAFCVNRAY